MIEPKNPAHLARVDAELERRVEELLGRMTLDEKVGQMSQTNSSGDQEADINQARRIGSFLNTPPEQRNMLQRAAMQETRLSIPLIFGRDVIHGYRTIFPIPLGQAASFNPEIAETGAAVAAKEARACGIDWTFAPMVDVSRDPRWGRIAESCGEDPLVASLFGAAMVRGFQGKDLSDPDRIAACAKHYIGYGAAEAGKDYNTTYIPERLLRDVYVPPFAACVEAGVATLMSAFNDLNGVPASGNGFTLRKILRGELGFRGFVVSDWDSLTEMMAHGFCEDQRQVALTGLAAGVDMEMVSGAYWGHLPALVAEGKVDSALLDDSVRAILRVKFLLGLFDRPYAPANGSSVLLLPEHLEAARQAARQSVVLLKNNRGILPLAKNSRRLAVIGPLADAPTDQLGCWIPDARAEDSVTPLTALREALAGAGDVFYAPGLENPSSVDRSGFDAAVKAAERSDVTLLFIGEEGMLSGEAHSRAFLDLPGAQLELLRAVAAAKRPIIVVVLAGRPLTIGPIVEAADALLYAWHPGTMAGPALADLLLGIESPSAKLPVTLPRTLGQVPIYYSHKNTGRPPTREAKGIPLGTPLDPWDFTSRHLDVETSPLFPFGFGLSYTQFEYRDLRLSNDTVPVGANFEASVELGNVGLTAAEEVVQLYVRDLVGNVTRPVKELKGFQRVRLAPGERRRVTFRIHTNDLAFWGRDMTFAAEKGRFQLWIGTSSDRGPRVDFTLV